jgi:hypothetical protein
LIRSQPGFPPRGTIASWIALDFNGFGARFYDAFAARCALMAHEIVEIVDEADSSSMPAVQSATNRYDARRWLLSRLIPSRFGERVEHRLDVNTRVELYLPDKRRILPGDDAQLIEGTAEKP